MMKITEQLLEAMGAYRTSEVWRIGALLVYPNPEGEGWLATWVRCPDAYPVNTIDEMFDVAYHLGKTSNIWSPSNA